MIVSVARQHFHHFVLNPHHGDIEGAAPQVIHQDVFAAVVGGFVGKRRRR